MQHSFLLLPSVKKSRNKNGENSLQLKTRELQSYQFVFLKLLVDCCCQEQTNCHGCVMVTKDKMEADELTVFYFTKLQISKTP